MRFIPIVLLALLTTVAPADERPGHSKHGSAFDSGMRSRPWEIPGVGSAHFPITTKNPEVQKWFDQGNALVHSFWFEEAERAFRWCLKLEPDNAMAYWGLARCGFTWFTVRGPDYDDKEFGRYKTFLKEAMRRKDKVSDRERMYIEAWATATAPGVKDGGKVLAEQLQNIVIKYPTDLEAKATLALFNIGSGSAFANQLLIDNVLGRNPMHPGAHHASIHNWDVGFNEYSREQSLNSCEQYGRVAPGVGHALHMPGHIYSKVGMWHEAAIAMDLSTRLELKYMNDRLALPFETWNFSHNRNYLCYIQEQLGMAEASLKGAKDLLDAPRDPENNSEQAGRVVMEGRFAQLRALIKFERWKEILDLGVTYGDEKNEFLKSNQTFAEAVALTGLGRLDEALEKLDVLKADYQKAVASMKDAKPDDLIGMSLPKDIAEGLIRLSQGKLLEGQKLLLNAAAEDAKYVGGDPPVTPWRVIRLLGDDYRKRGDNKLAIECYDRALKEEANDGFTLAGLALAHHAMGNIERATHFAGRLEYVWSQADPNLKWLTEVRKLGLTRLPIAETPRKERVYVPKELDAYGPMNWSPFAAPELKVKDINGKAVSLKDFKGKNVVLVFFLGEACVHCVGQLKAINDRMDEFTASNTVVLGVCSATPASLKASTTLGKVDIKFLSDTAHENARRFASYDDFEDMELHSTILIDGKGMVRWKRSGGDPFMNIDFLLSELKRIGTAGK